MFASGALHFVILLVDFHENRSERVKQVMTFDEVLTQTLTLLQQQGRMSYRALKRRFGLDDDYLEDLKAELIDAMQAAVDEDDKVLVWIGGEEASAQYNIPKQFQSPATYTPAHLADRILA